MCGIAGYVNEQWQDDERILESLQHRGPDGRGSLRFEGAGRKVWLGHTRLRIIDLSAQGAQPMSTPDGRLHLAYNGEVYNFEELRPKLTNKSFQSRTDTEVVLHHFHQHGVKGISALNGAFAMSFYDEKAHQLTLVRDRVGIKPLYYYHHNGHFCFGSEIKALLAAGAPAKMDENQLGRYLVFKYVPGQNTLFEGVKRVPPGHYLTYDVATDKVEVHPYWQPKVDPQVKAQGYRKTQEELEHLMEDATRMRLVADVPIATFLSGGLDSSIIAHFLRDEKAIRHYCAGKDAADLKAEGTTDDYGHAAALAKEWQLPLQKIAIGKEELTPEMLDQVVHFGDDLIADGSQIPSFLITQAAAKDCKVVLTGMGADEIFLGYAGHQLTVLDQRFHATGVLGKGLARQFKGLDVGKGRFKAIKRYLWKLGRYYDEPEHRFAWYSIVGDYQQALATLPGQEDSVTDFLKPYFTKDRAPFEALGHFERENFLVKNLSYVDRMSMANGLESRVPFLDHRIVELAHSMPRAWKLGNQGKTKKILKDTFASHLPSSIIKRRKAGFGMPLRALFSDRQRVDALLDFEHLESIAPFHLPAIRTAIDHHVAGQEDHSSLLFALIVLLSWHKRNLT